MKRLYKNWPVHNIIGHPLMQICNTFGMSLIANKVHDGTLPPNDVITQEVNMLNNIIQRYHAGGIVFNRSTNFYPKTNITKDIITIYSKKIFVADEYIAQVIKEKSVDDNELIKFSRTKELKSLTDDDIEKIFEFYDEQDLKETTGKYPWLYK